MNIGLIYTGHKYLYKPAGKRYPIVVEAIATDASKNMVLVLNLWTKRTMNVKATNLKPFKA